MSAQATTVAPVPQQDRKVTEIALIGNPNAGKSSVFNALTGLRQKVANYPGVTVEKKSGTLTTPSGKSFRLHDLPGLYSLISRSPDDGITVDILTGYIRDAAPIDGVVVVVDANNLSRGLYLVTQVRDIGLPVVVSLNMVDTAIRHGLNIDADKLSRLLGVPVVPTVAHRGSGARELTRAIEEMEHQDKAPIPPVSLNQTIRENLGTLREWLEAHSSLPSAAMDAESMRLVSNDAAVGNWQRRMQDTNGLVDIVRDIRSRLEKAGIPWHMLDTRQRYAEVDKIVKEAVTESVEASRNLSERLDRILTHKIFGPVIFVLVFAIVFQSIFTWAEVPMSAIESAVGWFGNLVSSWMPDGLLESLVVDGIINGVGAILAFLPQILFLFFFLSLLEESGYMARIAFIVDRLMQKAGLSGRSVIPLLSSFACAIPGIMATRTIQDSRDRLITIMIAPLMSCSARLPVYTLMIAAFIPSETYLGMFSVAGLTLLALYVLGIVAAVVAALAFKKVLLKGRKPSPFVLELPSYRMPSLRSAGFQMIDRSRIFLKDAGGIILAISIVLWFLATFPQSDPDRNLPPSQQLRESYAGQIGQFIEPVIEPLGFDWKLGIGLITSFAAREVMVATLATIYNVEGDDGQSRSLRDALRAERDPVTGEPVYGPLVAIALMVFFVLACQCMATVAVVKRETNSWRWPLFMVAYMTVMAYIGAFVVYQGGKLLGYA